MKTRQVLDTNGDLYGWEIRCPACDEPHIFHTGRAPRPRWEFDGNMEKPTFTPSLKLHHDGNEHMKPFCCHTNVINGMIQYHGDCTHAMAGQTIELPELKGDR